MQSEQTIFWLDNKSYLQHIFETLDIREKVQLNYTRSDLKKLVSRISKPQKIRKLFHHLEGIIIPTRENNKPVICLKKLEEDFLGKS